MRVHCHVEGDEESVKAYAMIDANLAAVERLESFYPPRPPVEKFMTLETVNEQRGKIDALLAKMRQREATMTREIADG